MSVNVMDGSARDTKLQCWCQYIKNNINIHTLNAPYIPKISKDQQQKVVARSEERGAGEAQATERLRKQE